MFCSPGTRGICEMVSDGGGQFIPAYIVGVKHIIFITFVPDIAHDRATKDNHTQQAESLILTSRNELLVGTVHKPRQGGIKSVPL